MLRTDASSAVSREEKVRIEIHKTAATGTDRLALSTQVRDAKNVPSSILMTLFLNPRCHLEITLDNTPDL